MKLNKIDWSSVLSNDHWLKKITVNIINDIYIYIDGLGQERHNSIANALELCVSCTNPSYIYIYDYTSYDDSIQKMSGQLGYPDFW